MDRYHVNNRQQSNGDHEVHKEGCYWLSRADSTKDLGLHSSCWGAVNLARTIYPTANGCATCARACHTG